MPLRSHHDVRALLLHHIEEARQHRRFEIESPSNSSTCVPRL